MSLSPIDKERIENGDSVSAEGDCENTGDTSRLDSPVSVKVTTPSTVMEETARRATFTRTMTSDSYFVHDPAGDEQQAQTLASTNAAPLPTDSPSILTVEGQPQSLESPSIAQSGQRPAPHSQISSLSIQSADSAATITAASSVPALAAHLQQRPPFPNQSYAALHHQRYPAPHVPPSLKQRSSHPGQIYTFTSALASVHHQSGAKTVGNSPAVTPGPGLFNSQVQTPQPLEREPSASDRTYSSPFLHFTQRVPPKETHVADVDVDPVSGRKLINHYEIMDELGRGTHGKVKLGRDLDNNGKYVAIKIVERFSKRRKLGKLGTTEDKVKKEVAILKKARHPHIVALLEVIDDPSRKKVYIVLEWVELGEIHWRTRAPKEVAQVEARRYEREKKSQNDAAHSNAEEAAVVEEAQRRLTRQIRRQRRTFRLARRDVADAPEAWSNELMGDDHSDLSEDDKMSRISTESYSSRFLSNDAYARRTSRTPSPLPPASANAHSTASDAGAYYHSVSGEPQAVSPSTSTRDFSDSVYTGLEGTMYGAYVPYSREQSRVPSLSSRPQSQTNSDNLSHLAMDILDSELDPELQYVPLMTMQQIRVAFRDTLLGLQYLHEQGIIHRDIKPPNLLATIDHRVKISDFGVSYLGRPIVENEPGEDVSEHEAQDLDDEAKELAKTVGTPAFYAPELCITDHMDDPPPITKAIDVWALGVTLFCMLFARTPFVDTEFVVMRQIADEEVYIPWKRLRPVEPNSSSRPPSRGRDFPPSPTGHRHELEFAYEAISDELYDLLRRMLNKDPRNRISLDEIRHHAWLVEDIQDKVSWLEETEPLRHTQGKKIEVSKEDVNAAVVPLQFMDRVRSSIKKVGERLGFGSKSTGRGRSRSNVGSANDNSPAPSNTPSSTGVSHHERTYSPRGDESMVAALKASTQVERPSPTSAVSSPDYERPESALSSRAPLINRAMSPHGNAPDYDHATMTTSGSMRTVRQADFRRSIGQESPPASPGLPTSPAVVDSPSRSSGGWGGGMAQRILKTVRERSTARSPSSDRGSVASIDTHGEPSLAVSSEIALGHMNAPLAIDEITSRSALSSAHNSPSAPRPLSTVSSPSVDRLYPFAAERGPLSRTSSGGSISSIGRLGIVQNANVSSPVGRHSRVPTESTAEEWQRAEGEHIRKLIQESKEEQRPPSAFDDRTCPPSPDDQRQRPEDLRRPSTLDISNPDSSLETSPTGQQSHLPSGMVSSTSDFGSAVSMSISNPSIPSVITESSLDSLDAIASAEPERKTDLMSSDDTIKSNPQSEEELRNEGYQPDDPSGALRSDDSDEYDSSSDSDGGLVMTRQRTKILPGAEVSNPAGSDGRERRGTGLSARSKKTSRSGSSNTMHHVRIDDNGDERRRPSLDTTEP